MGGGRWVKKGDIHMVAARHVFEKAMVGTGWATSHPDCMDRLRNRAYLISGMGCDGTGRFRKMCVPNFRDDRTITEILTCLNPGIMQIAECLIPGSYFFFFGPSSHVS